jgi:hypothetical protein
MRLEARAPAKRLEGQVTSLGRFLLLPYGQPIDAYHHKTAGYFFHIHICAALDNVIGRGQIRERDRQQCGSKKEKNRVQKLHDPEWTTIGTNWNNGDVRERIESCFDKQVSCAIRAVDERFEQ